MKKQGKKTPPGAQPSKRALARIPEEAPESQAGGSIEMVSEEDSGAAQARSALASRSAPVGDRLSIPEGGLVAMRRSGGLRFTSRTVVVFRDGRVTSQDRTGPPTERMLDDQELAALYRALEDAFEELPAASTGRQNPDAYAYELVADLEGTEHSAEVFDGNMPKEIERLIRLLSSYIQPRSA